jgi:hypothetical protein
MAFDRYAQSIPELLGDLLTQTTTLVRQEGRLASAEISEKIGQATGAVALLLIGAVLMIPAMVILLDAVVLALVQSDWSPAAAAALVGGIAIVLGAILLLIGKSRLAPSKLAPTRTVQQLQQDAAVAQDQFRTTQQQARSHNVHANRAA